jgi:hypothetical protein
MIGMGREQGGTFFFMRNLQSSAFVSPKAAQVFSANSDSLWYFCLGHLFDIQLKLLFPDCNLVSSKCCSIFPIAKQHRLPFHVSTSISKRSFDLIHCDIWRPFSVKSTNSSSYFLTIVDDYTRFIWVYLMQSKSQARPVIQAFFELILLNSIFLHSYSSSFKENSI